MDAPKTAAGRLAAVAPHLVVGLVCALFIQTGWRGIDFGTHWDEHYHVESARRTVETGVLLPIDYWHPSATYILTFACAAPELVARLVGEPIDLKATLASEAWPLRVRRVFVVLSALAMVFVHLLMSRWQGGGPARAWEGAFAAALLGTSWQFAFHSRWIAADAVMASFAALATMCLVLSRDEALPRRGLFWTGVVFAGVCTASKYTTGLLLVSCLVTAACWTRGEAKRAIVERLGLTVIVFAVTTVAITPGMIIEAPRFFRRVLMQADIYGSSGFHGYTIDGHARYIVAVVRYLITQLFSPSPWLAAGLSLLIPAGLLRLWRERAVHDRVQVVVMLLFGALYLGFFATQKAFIARNFLVVAPTLAILSALGAGFIVSDLWRRSRPAAVVVVLGLVMALMTDARFLMTAAETIVDRRSDRFIREFAAWLDARPAEDVVVSARVGAALSTLEATTDGNPQQLTASPTTSTTLMAAYAWEALRRTEWPANDPDLTVEIFGPLEMDFTMYPTWQGDERIVVLTLEKARAIGATIPGVSPAKPQP